MLSLKITETRNFMKKLLASDLFDSFLVSGAKITTFTTFSIDGTWHPSYFKDTKDGEADVSEISQAQPDTDSPAYPSWKILRGTVFDIVKGHHTPLSMRIVLVLSPANTGCVIKNAGLALTASDVDGLFFNISYTDAGIILTTGTSMKTFTLDKSLEHAWDDAALKFLTARQITFEKL